MAANTPSTTMQLNDCHNHHDFRRLAQGRLPGPIFNDIDGAAGDETTHRSNAATSGYSSCHRPSSIGIQAAKSLVRNFSG
jgi:hypothetical protein